MMKEHKLCNFPQPPVTAFLSHLNIPLITLFSNSLSLNATFSVMTPWSFVGDYQHFRGKSSWCPDDSCDKIFQNVGNH
jgi:hypothetical protein